jgi:hypothetical protein
MELVEQPDSQKILDTFPEPLGSASAAPGGWIATGGERPLFKDREIDVLFTG